MSRAEDHANDRLDRSKGKAGQSARFAELDRMAASAAAVPFSTPADALTFLRLLVGHAFARLCQFDTRHQTKSYFGMLASGQDFRGLTRSMEAAERLFAKPANDTETLTTRETP